MSLEINLSDQNFPAELGGLSIWEEAYERDSRYSLGFSTTVVLGTNGVTPFGTSGCGHRGELETAINYNADKFLAYLQASRELFLENQRAVEEHDTEAAEKIELEARAQLREANICKCEVKKEIFPTGTR